MWLLECIHQELQSQHYNFSYLSYFGYNTTMPDNSCQHRISYTNSTTKIPRWSQWLISYAKSQKGLEPTKLIQCLYLL